MIPSRHCVRSEAIQLSMHNMDCRIAYAPRNDDSYYTP